MEYSSRTPLQVTTLSFRGDDMKTVTLMHEGQYPAGGALFIGPESALALVGVSDQVLFNASLAPGEQRNGKAAAGKKRKAPGGSSAKSKARGAGVDGVMSATAKDSMDGIAAKFVLSTGDDTMMSTLSSALHVTQDGAHRLRAAEAGAVDIRDSGATRLRVTYGSTHKREPESVRKLSAAECVEVMKCVLLRQVGYVFTSPYPCVLHKNRMGVRE